jgi:hypothetical protein
VKYHALSPCLGHYRSSEDVDVIEMTQARHPGCHNIPGVSAEPCMLALQMDAVRAGERIWTSIHTSKRSAFFRHILPSHIFPFSSFLEGKYKDAREEPPTHICGSRPVSWRLCNMLFTVLKRDWMIYMFVIKRHVH